MSVRFRYGRERSDGTGTGARGAAVRYQSHFEHVAPAEKMKHLTRQGGCATGPAASQSDGLGIRRRRKEPTRNSSRRPRRLGSVVKAGF